MYNLIERLIYLIAYIGLILGVWLVMYPIINPFIKRKRISRRFRSSSLDFKTVRKKNQLVSHIEMLLSITVNSKSSYIILSFYVISLTLFFLSLLILINLNSQSYVSGIISIVVGLIPYLILRINLHNIRVNSSYEAEALITELNNQYKINYLNMVEAIDKTIPRLKKQPFSKKALYSLSLSIKQYQSKEELEQIIAEFNYSINTGWSILLANNLFLSIEYGDDVRESLDDIVEDLKDLKKINEKNKQYNYESFVMIKYIAPGTYLLSVAAMFLIFDFTTTKYIEYQFKNPLGLKFFLITMVLITINFLIYFLIKKPKNDF